MMALTFMDAIDKLEIDVTRDEDNDDTLTLSIGDTPEDLEYLIMRLHSAWVKAFELRNAWEEGS